MLGAVVSPILLPILIALAPITFIVRRRIARSAEKAIGPSSAPRLHSQNIGPIATTEDERLVAAYEAAMREKRTRGE
jgi:hypothetical protein